MIPATSNGDRCRERGLAFIRANGKDFGPGRVHAQSNTGPGPVLTGSPVQDPGDTMNSQERPRRLDAVEIKVTVGADGIPAAAEALNLSTPKSGAGRSYFCEDLAGPDGPAGLPLLAHGTILRLRRNKGRRGDITAKLRP